MAWTGSTRRVLLATPLALIALALSAGPSAADPHALPKIKEVTTQVETTGIALPELKCPQGHTLLTTFWRDVNGLAEVHAANLTKNSATFFVRKLVGDSATVVVGIRCVKKETGLAKDAGATHFHELSIKVATGTVTVPGMGGQVAVEAKCPVGTSARNAAYTDFGSTRAEMSRPAADGDGWEFLFTNVGNTDTTAIVDAICLGDKTGVAKGKKPTEKEKKKGKKRKKPKNHRHRSKKKKVPKKVPAPGSPNPRMDVAPVEGVINCPAGFFPIGLGYNFLGHPFTFLGAFDPVRTTTGARRRQRATTAGGRNGGARYKINNQSTEDEFDLDLECDGSDTGSDRVK